MNPQLSLWTTAHITSSLAMRFLIIYIGFISFYIIFLNFNISFLPKTVLLDNLRRKNFVYTKCVCTMYS